MGLDNFIQFWRETREHWTLLLLSTTNHELGRGRFWKGSNSCWGKGHSPAPEECNPEIKLGGKKSNDEVCEAMH